MRVSAILMAAGLSRRMRADKLLLPIRGSPMLSRAVALLAAVPFHQRLLVTTPQRLKAIAVPPGIQVLVNRHPERGQSESMRLGVAAADGDAYLFLPADQPLLTQQVLAQLLAHADREHIVYPVVDGTPRSPAIFPAIYRDELLAQQGDSGGRRVRDAHPEALLPLPMSDPAPFQDVDSPEDYAEICAALDTLNN